jgi:hypothetical protein
VDFWEETPCSKVERYKHFGATYYSTLKMQRANSSETSSLYEIMSLMVFEQLLVKGMYFGKELFHCTIHCTPYRRATRRVLTGVAKRIKVDGGIFENVLY